MHDYAVFGHDRAAVGRWLGVAAIILAGGIAQLCGYANSLTGTDVFTKATLTTGAVYFALHWLFNKIIWKFNCLDIPDLNGKWKVAGQSLNDDGTTRYNWDGEIAIEQTWKMICIHLKTTNSQSQSYTSSISKRFGPTGGWLLSYSYRNEPELEQSHELNSHKGYCEIEFDNTFNKGKASYFNSGGRKTYGVMSLEKIEI